MFLLFFFLFFFATPNFTSQALAVIPIEPGGSGATNLAAITGCYGTAGYVKFTWSSSSTLNGDYWLDVREVGGSWPDAAHPGQNVGTNLQYTWGGFSGINNIGMASGGYTSGGFKLGQAYEWRIWDGTAQAYPTPSSFTTPSSCTGGGGSAPAPAPCQNAVATDYLTDHYITDSNGNPFGITSSSGSSSSFTITGSGTPGSTVTATANSNPTFSYTLDMSKLQAIFADTNSNYNEGQYQNPEHQQAPLLKQTTETRDNFFGPSQKAAPNVMTNQLRVQYVNYVFNKPTLSESQSAITDVNGQNPMTIYDMVKKWGYPDPGSSSFQSTWGPYWAKIPISYNEYYQGKLEFRAAIGTAAINAVKDGADCPKPFDSRPPITFILPNTFRAAAVTGQVNMLMAPKVAQSSTNNVLYASTQFKENVLAQIIKKCVFLASQNSLTKALKKVVSQINSVKLNPVKNAYAANDNTGCVKVLGDGRSGTAPYCALPPGQLPASACSQPNANDPNQLDPQNPNVVCTVTFSFSKQMVLPTTGNGDWDSCTISGATETCTATASIWADFRIPWIGEIWNHTLASDNSESLDMQSPQQTGRPGVYAFFTPNLVLKSANQGQQDPKIALLQNMLNQCLADPPLPSDPLNFRGCAPLVNWANTAAADAYPQLKQCVVDNLLHGAGPISNCVALLTQSIISSSIQKMPGQVGGTLGVSTSNVLGDTTGEGQQPVIGSTDCLKMFVRDMALKPLVLQKYLNIDTSCIPKTIANPTSASSSTPTSTAPTPIPAATPIPAPTAGPIPTPAATPVSATPIPSPSVFCNTASSTIPTNTNATFTASGGTGTYFWNASGGNPSTGSGPSFTTQFANPGNYTVKVTSGSSQGGCSVTVQAPNTSLNFSWSRPWGYAAFIDVNLKTSNCRSGNLSCSTPTFIFWPGSSLIFAVHVTDAGGPTIKSGGTTANTNGSASMNWDWTYVALVYPTSFASCTAAGSQCKTQTINDNGTNPSVTFTGLQPATTYQETVCTPNCGTGLVILSKQTST